MEPILLSSMDLEESKVFRDPIHHYIKVNHRIIWDLINTKEFQRLRRIRQLGGTSQVYQTAEHSRFTHSLGVYEITRMIVLEHEQISNILSDEEKLTVMCAGLLHDIGHGPFSHAFEHVFNQDHEAYTVKMILEDTEINKVLTSYHPTLPRLIASVIDKTHSNPILIQLVSSQLDADRMDYLLRDSYFTGTAYGTYDMHRLLRTMRIVDNHIVFKQSGVQAIENYILARYHMYWQVYFHPTARSYEQLLVSIFKRLKYLYTSGYQFKTNPVLLYPIFENRILSCEEYFLLDEANVYFYFTMFQQEEDTILKDLTTRFMNRHLFKYTPYTTDDDYLNLKAQLVSKGYDPTYYLHRDDQIQIPYKYYGDTRSIGDIKILGLDDSVIDLPMASEIVHAIVTSNHDKTDQMVYFPK